MLGPVLFLQRERERDRERESEEHFGLKSVSLRVRANIILNGGTAKNQPDVPWSSRPIVDRHCTNVGHSHHTQRTRETTSRCAEGGDWGLGRGLLQCNQTTEPFEISAHAMKQDKTTAPTEQDVQIVEFRMVK